MNKLKAVAAVLLVVLAFGSVPTMFLIRDAQIRQADEEWRQFEIEEWYNECRYYVHRQMERAKGRDYLIGDEVTKARAASEKLCKNIKERK